jgi:2-dehydro-3-deoxygalactonokinase
VKLLVIDCGTTNCRMRLVDGDVIVQSVTKQTGAKDVAITGNNDALRKALRESYLELSAAHPKMVSSVEMIIASGMITSNMGLMEVPHIDGPVGRLTLARRLQLGSFPDICPKPFLFVPGVKFMVHSDMIRGEEAEICGLLGKEEHGCQLIMHYGSHHKWIQVQGSSMKACITSISGELLMALSEHTLLKNSLVPLDDVQIELDWVRKGKESERAFGAGRALFSVRTMDILHQQGKQAATNFLLGIIVSLDLAMLTEELTRGINRVVLYGRSLFPSIMAPMLHELNPDLPVTIVSEDESARLSVYGAAELYTLYKEEITL